MKGSTAPDRQATLSRLADPRRLRLLEVLSIFDTYIEGPPEEVDLDIAYSLALRMDLKPWLQERLERKIAEVWGQEPSLLAWRARYAILIAMVDRVKRGAGQARLEQRMEHLRSIPLPSKDCRMQLDALEEIAILRHQGRRTRPNPLWGSRAPWTRTPASG